MFGKIHTWMMVFCACFGAMRSGEMSTQTNSTIASLAKVDVAFCLAVKVVCDVDVEDLIEWIDYHAALGVGKFYVMDHNSSVSITQGLWSYLANDIVEYRFVPAANKDENYHLFIYEKCMKDFGQKHSFMGFLDVDEFVVVKAPRPFLSILGDYLPYGGLTLNWMLFGSSGHTSRPPGGVIVNYVKCRPNIHIKTIVNTKYFSSVSWSPHHFEYIAGYHAVDTSYHPVSRAINPETRYKNPVMWTWVFDVPPHLYEVMYVNHYILKSRDDYELRAKRASQTAEGYRRRDGFFEEMEKHMTNSCPVLQMPLPNASHNNHERTMHVGTTKKVG